MITRYLTAVQATFSPLKARHRHARAFLAQLPSNARAETKITIKQLPRESKERSSLVLTFSKL